MKLKTILYSLLFLSAMLAGTVGCKSAATVPQPTKETTTNVDTKTTEHVGEIATKPDSTQYRAQVECQEGKVVIKRVYANKPGNYLRKPDVAITDNTLSVDCKAEAQKLFYKWRDTYVKEYKGEVTKIPYPVERNPSWWETTQIWCGRLFMLLVVGFLVRMLWKFMNPKIV